MKYAGVIWRIIYVVINVIKCADLSQFLWSRVTSSSSCRSGEVVCFVHGLVFWIGLKFYVLHFVQTFMSLTKWLHEFSPSGTAGLLRNSASSRHSHIRFSSDMIVQHSAPKRMRCHGLYVDKKKYWSAITTCNVSERCCSLKSGRVKQDDVRPLKNDFSIFKHTHFFYLLSVTIHQSTLNKVNSDLRVPWSRPEITPKQKTQYVYVWLKNPTFLHTLSDQTAFLSITDGPLLYT